MKRMSGWVLAAAVVGGIGAWAGAQEQPESVYAPPGPPKESEKTNEGAINLDMRVDYATDYVFRGIEPFESPTIPEGPNFQFDGRVTWDLGSRLPHPWVGMFANVMDGDPVSDLQEIRPNAGFDWTLRPLTFSAGHNTYYFPDRHGMNTNEFFVQVKFDDSVLVKGDRPILSPYVFAAYDYDTYEGLYIQAGVSHDFVIEDTGLTITADGHVAYVLNHKEFIFDATGQDTGFQHWQVGLTGKYSLNTLLNMPKRYGDWTLIGYVNYTDGIDHHLRSISEMWGGAGIALHY